MPIVVPAPEKYRLTGKGGAVSPGPHRLDPGRPRSAVQDDVWNWIWLRRVVYFLTASATAFVAFIPFFVIYWPEFGRAAVGGFVGPLVNAAASFLPSVLEPWFVAFRDAPGFVLIGVIAIGILMWIGTNLQETIHDVSRLAWHTPTPHTPPTGWRAGVYQLRRYRIYRVFFYVGTHWIVPTAIMWWLFWWLAFGTANTLGLVCRGTGGVEVEMAGNAMMKTAKACSATNLKVTQGKTYRITLTIGEAWADDDIPTDPNGFNNHHAGRLQLLGVPFKRLIWSNWFATILRVGGPGFEEHLLKLTPQPGGAWTTTFEPRSSGEVFLYVNDTTISLPWAYNLFYLNNWGTAQVKIEKLP